MKIFLFKRENFLLGLVLITASFFSSFSSIDVRAAEELSLAEKIALAKKLADEAAVGKTEAGRVVNGTFNFAEELSNYRKSLKAQNVVSLQQEDVEPELELEKPTTVDVPKEPLKEREFEKTVAKVESSKPLIEKVESPKVDSINTENFSKPKDSAISSGSAIPMERPPEISPDKRPPKPEYKVDMSEFSGDYYVGHLDSKENAKTMERVEKTLEKSKNYANAITSMFFIDCDNTYALSEVKNIANLCERLVGRVFGEYLASLNDTNKIIIQIYASELSGLKNPYDLKVDNRGLVTISIKWNGRLDKNLVCNLLARAALRKVADRCFSKKEIPYWLETAFTQHLRGMVGTGVSAHLARIISDSPSASISEILNYSRYGTQTQNVKEAYCYYLLVCAEKLARSSERFNALMRDIIVSDVSKTELLLKNLDVRFVTNSDIFFETFISGEVWSRLGGVNTPKQTDMEVARLSVLQVNDDKGERVALADSSLWLNRESIASDIEARVTEIKVALVRANPLFHNCLVSLGKMYEACLDDDENEFSKSRTMFIQEYGDARKISSEINKIITE